MPSLLYILLGYGRLSERGLSVPRSTSKLRRRFLGVRVVHERAGSKLDTGEVLETVTTAVRWIQLDMEVGLRPLASVGGRLVHGHHVRRREAEVAVICAGRAEHGLRQVFSLAGVEIGDGGDMPARVDVHLIRPASRPRHEWQGVDLAVRVMERDPDLFALVLEDVDVGDLRPRAELAVAVGPNVDEEPDPLQRQARQGQLVLGRVDDDLAARRRWTDRTPVAPVGPERRKAVLEHNDLERVERYLGCAAWPAWTQRAEVGGEEGPVVALGGVCDPFAPQWIEAKLRHRLSMPRFRCAHGRTQAGSGRRAARGSPGSANLFGGRRRCSAVHGAARACRHAVARLLSTSTSSPATRTSTPASRMACSSAGSALESVMSVCTRAAGTVWHIVSCPILVWSASTTTCWAAPARARSVAATTGLGVLSPRSAVKPLPEMNACDARSARTDSSVAGPTRAWMGRRSVPPVRITSTREDSINACATSSELVTTVSSG